MKEFLIHSIIVIMGIAMFIGLFVMDKWLGPFWSLLLGLVLFMAFIIGIIFVVGKAMGEVNKYKSEVEMKEEMKLADSFNEHIEKSKTEKPNNKWK